MTIVCDNKQECVFFEYKIPTELRIQIRELYLLVELITCRALGLMRLALASIYAHIYILLLSTSLFYYSYLALITL